MHTVDRDAFEALVQAAVAALPDGFRRRIENLQITVEDRARPDDYTRTSTPRSATLLGVYRGVPLTARTSSYNLTLPDRIVIFQQPLQRLARDEAHLNDLVQRTVRHEIAHYFGISDQRLHELGAY